MGLIVANPKGLPPGTPVISFSPQNKDGVFTQIIRWYEGDKFTRPTEPRGCTASMEKDWIKQVLLVEEGGSA